MKEIKYRAWDKVRNKMFDVTLINFKDKLVSIFYDSKSDFEETQQIIKDYNVPFSRVELLQCLGVKDKKGKEIYEGDIVEWTYPNPDDDCYKDESIFGNIFGVVHWNEEICSFEIEQISRDTFMFDKNDKYERIHPYELRFYDVDGKEFNWDELEIVNNIYEGKEFYENELKKYNEEES